MSSMTPAQVAHSVATTPEQRARELANVARAQAHVAMEDALKAYAQAVSHACRQHADRIRARSQSSYRSPVQAHHDYEWASALFWSASRAVNAAAADAERTLVSSTQGRAA